MIGPNRENKNKKQRQYIQNWESVKVSNHHFKPDHKSNKHRGISPLTSTSISFSVMDLELNQITTTILSSSFFCFNQMPNI